MLERAKQVLGDKRVMMGALLGAHSGFLAYTIIYPVPSWLVALVAAGVGAQIVNFANFVRLGTVNDLLDEVRDLNESVRERYEEACNLVADIEGADAIAVLKNGKVINSHVVKVPTARLH